MKRSIVIISIMIVTAVLILAMLCRDKEKDSIEEGYKTYEDLHTTAVEEAETTEYSTNIYVAEQEEESSSIEYYITEESTSDEGDTPLYYVSQDMKYVEGNPKLKKLLEYVMEENHFQLKDVQIEIYENNEVQFEGTFTFTDFSYMDFYCYDTVSGMLFYSDGSEYSTYTVEDNDGEISVKKTR